MKPLDSKTKLLLTDPVKRRVWIKYHIHMQGNTLAQIAKENGVDRHPLYNVFRAPYPRMELIVATALGYTPKEIFPERYDDDGLPNRMMGRPQKSSTLVTNNTMLNAGRNVHIDDVNEQESAA